MKGLTLKTKSMLLSIALGVIAVFCLDIWLIDGIGGGLHALQSSTHDSTSYSISYSDKGFKAVRTGMSSEDVTRLLGQPLYVRGPIPPPESDGKGPEAWMYSVPSNMTEGAFYRHRAIFVKEGVVTDIVSGVRETAKHVVQIDTDEQRKWLEDNSGNLTK